MKKKTGPKPRPIRVGELWRRVVAKRIVHDRRADMQKAMLDCNQLGVAI